MYIFVFQVWITNIVGLNAQFYKSYNLPTIQKIKHIPCDSLCPMDSIHSSSTTSRILRYDGRYLRGVVFRPQVRCLYWVTKLINYTHFIWIPQVQHYISERIFVL
jgi:hypothetical protein